MTDSPPDATDDLQRLVRDRLAELGDSTRDAARRSHGLVAHSTLARIASGEYRGKRLKADTIAGIALALQVPESKVMAAAEASLYPAQWLRLSNGFARLDAEGQARAIEMMRQLLDEHENRSRQTRRRKHPFG